ncbi:hypothetical protein HWV62_28258 [Athelia sp. TMB]|nr:hypothetical protein HWV62_28258 [Athelia sp. TMB]
MVKRPDPDKRYEVEVILAAQVDDTGSWEYLVKWYNWSEFWNSWEPAQNLKDCQDRVNAFWDHFRAARLPQDKKRVYDTGFVFGASPDWISESAYLKYTASPLHDVEEDQKARAVEESNLRRQLGYDDLDVTSEPITILLPPPSYQISNDPDEYRLPTSNEIRVPRKQVSMSRAKVASSALNKPPDFNDQVYDEGNNDIPPSPSSLFSRSPSPVLLPEKPYLRTRINPLPIDTHAPFTRLTSKHRIARMAAPTISLFAPDATSDHPVSALDRVSEINENIISPQPIDRDGWVLRSPPGQESDLQRQNQTSLQRGEF